MEEKQILLGMTGARAKALLSDLQWLETLDETGEPSNPDIIAELHGQIYGNILPGKILPMPDGYIPHHNVKQSASPNKEDAVKTESRSDDKTVFYVPEGVSEEVAKDIEYYGPKYKVRIDDMEIDFSEAQLVAAKKWLNIEDEDIDLMISQGKLTIESILISYHTELMKKVPE